MFPWTRPTTAGRSARLQDSPGAPLRGLLLHYTGGHWQAVGISSTGYAGGGTIHMVSADEGWLYAPIGAKTSPDHKTLLLHYQGGTWHLVSSLPGDVLFSMLSATDGWAADIETDAIYHYQKGNWTQVASATGQPLVMAMVSSSEGWIAGSEAGTGSGKSAFVMRYDGQSWTSMALPSASDAEVDQITVAAPGDIWLIGQVHTSTMAPTAVAWHYSSGTWTLVNLNWRPSPPAPRWPRHLGLGDWQRAKQHRRAGRVCARAVVGRLLRQVGDIAGAH